MISENQFGFMPVKSIIEPIFAYRLMMGKWRRLSGTPNKTTELGELH